MPADSRDRPTGSLAELTARLEQTPPNLTDQTDLALCYLAAAVLRLAAALEQPHRPQTHFEVVPLHGGTDHA